MDNITEKLEHNQYTRIKLNVGGFRFETTEHTLICKDKGSFFESMIVSPNTVKDDQGSYFIDRDGILFGYILNFLRDGDVALPSTDLELAQLVREARFYGLYTLENLIDTKRRNLRTGLLQQHQYLRVPGYEAPRSMGTSFVNSQYICSSSGSGFSSHGSATIHSLVSDNFSERRVDPLTDTARDLFVGSTSSKQPQSNSHPHDSFYLHNPEGPFGNAPFDGPFGPPITITDLAPFEIFTMSEDEDDGPGADLAVNQELLYNGSGF